MKFYDVESVGWFALPVAGFDMYSSKCKLSNFCTQECKMKEIMRILILLGVDHAAVDLWCSISCVLGHA